MRSKRETFTCIRRVKRWWKETYPTPTRRCLHFIYYPVKWQSFLSDGTTSSCNLCAWGVLAFMITSRICFHDNSNNSIFTHYFLRKIDDHQFQSLDRLLIFLRILICIDRFYIAMKVIHNVAKAFFEFIYF